MRKRVFYSSIFTLFITILFLSPISGDDWGNYLIGIKGLRHSIGVAVGMYFDWEGRFISRVLINILTYHKVLWNIVNASFITSIVFMFIKIINPKNKKVIYLLSLLVILLMNVFTFSQVVSWVAGNITYLFVIPLLLIYFYYIFDIKNKNKLYNFIFIILNLTMTMFIEHMAVILIFSNILFLGYRFMNNKKIDKEILSYLIISIIGTLIMLCAPGNIVRTSMENLEFQKLSFINKLFYNIPNFINYTFIINYFLILLLISSSIYLIKKYIDKKPLKYFLYLFMIPIPIGSTICYLLFNLKLSNNLLLANYNSKLIILYYIIYLIALFYLILLETKNSKNIKILFFFIIGIGSNIVMLISPVWGYRTSFASYIFLSLASIMIIDKYSKGKKLSFYILLILSIIMILFYIILYISTYYQYLDNSKRINKCIKNNCKELEIIKYPHYINCNINPENDFHLERYKKYFLLDDDVKVILKDNNWKYLIFYNSK